MNKDLQANKQIETIINKQIVHLPINDLQLIYNFLCGPSDLVKTKEQCIQEIINHFNVLIKKYTNKKDLNIELNMVFDTIQSSHIKLIINNIYEITSKQQQLYHNNKCFCQKVINYESKLKDCVYCANEGCTKGFHIDCLKLKNHGTNYLSNANANANANLNADGNEKYFECPYCILSKCDPLNEVMYVLVEPWLINKERQEKKIFIINILYRHFNKKLFKLFVNFF